MKRIVSKNWKKGLYDPSREKDACGVALLAHLKGVPSHSIVQDATTALARMEHRGGCGCEENTGDGSGILIGMPHEFMQSVAAESGISNLGPPGTYASGLLFLSHDERARSAQMNALEVVAERLDLKVLGWRKPPTDNTRLGPTAVASEPYVTQAFVGQGPKYPKGVDMERHLVLLRKLAAAELNRPADFYVASLSSRTITYKGQLTSYQLPLYYRDLVDPIMKSHMAMVHSRFSTNTFPSWDRAQPNRMLCHNGEINTLRGNKNWVASRMASMEVPYLMSGLPISDNSLISKGISTRDLYPFTSDDKTDSGNLDAVLELLVRGSEARSLPEAMMMMVPEAWQSSSKQDEKRSFYEFHSCLQEPWDGPAMMAFTDGRYMGAVLDRNGLRPSRYYVTKDDRVLLSSEVGVLPDLDPAIVLHKGRLEPGKMFLVDFEKGGLVHDQELKYSIATKRPYGQWIKESMSRLDDWPIPTAVKHHKTSHHSVLSDLHTYGYNTETIDILVQPMANTGKEALGSMGIDIPPAILSRQPQLPFAYMKQLFAQVTNPPIDPIREEIVMSLECPVGPEANIFSEPSSRHCKRLVISHPILTDDQMIAIQSSDSIKNSFQGSWYSSSIQCSFKKGGQMDVAIDEICEKVAALVRSGCPIVILNQHCATKTDVPIPSLLITGAVHHYLISQGLRTSCALIVEAGDAREVHDFCTLVGFGADAIHPSVAYRAVETLFKEKRLPNVKTKEEALENYRHAAGKGMLKVMAKMGISTLQSYKGAQIFECVGLNDEVCSKCFPGTASRIGGAGFANLATDAEEFHSRGFSLQLRPLYNPGDYHYRDAGEIHFNTPAGMADLQIAGRTRSSEAYQRYSAETRAAGARVSLRGLLELDLNNKAYKPLDLSQVEPASEIVKRFCTGAMSLGSISMEAHETLAVAMNQIHGKSNTGEGGESADRFIWKGPNGESKRSAIKQVASGRFGVTSNYLANADQIQIKMAQGAKPGEGGELPGYKVSKMIAKVRGTTPGVGLISPPPHHDIYSIEDLAQLIHDLKSSNPKATVSVKLVSEVGVGVVAAGCAKAKADHITISGGDGGTGAAAWTGVHKAGLPWELGLAEAQHTLVLNDLRSRVVLQADGQMKTGRDVIVAALLGAEEVAFSTAPLIALGCIMMRKCHLNTCPVGIATQDPVLREKFAGKPEHVVNYLFFVAEEVRDYMAALGFRTWNEMIGRSDRLNLPLPENLTTKTKLLDLRHLLYPSARLNENAGLYKTKSQDHKLEESLDHQLIIKAQSALENQEPVSMEFPVTNLDRTVGTILSYEISKRYGENGLPDDTISIKLEGNSGQSLGFALAKGITIDLEGDANDYVGKSLSGGKIIVRPPRVLLEQGFVSEDNVIVGNVCLYGATSGEAYFRGKAGERFCVRNSGAKCVVEGVGDHGCEYMTGGRVVILGKTGRNFAAGMSGGIAYIFDVDGDFEDKCNTEMVRLEKVSSLRDEEELRVLLENHLRNTDSVIAQNILENWETSLNKFVKVLPEDYARVLKEQEQQELAEQSEGKRVVA